MLILGLITLVVGAAQWPIGMELIQREEWLCMVETTVMTYF